MGNAAGKWKPPAGGMGEVHRAHDLQTGDTVAVKLIWRLRTGEEVCQTALRACG